MAAAVPAQRQHGLPELRALPAPHDLRERGVRAAAPEGQGFGDQGQGLGDAPSRRAAWLRAPQADPDLGRPGPARGSGPGPDQPAGRPPPRRAARRARPQAAQGDAGRAQADPAGGRDHVHLRDPRPGGGDDDVRSHRRHEPRPLRTARCAPDPQVITDDGDPDRGCTTSVTGRSPTSSTITSWPRSLRRTIHAAMPRSA